jgi:hypothetical protein
MSCISGAYVSMTMHVMGAYLIGMYLMGMHVMGMHLISTYLIGIHLKSIANERQRSLGCDDYQGGCYA